ncbi:MAG TPA: porin family protein [Saprospiraceae bacterium]|nr:PorT family protein [Saprospiraceae bacterium]HMV23246.1 porin family protein [Saprospiraceae bacterium]HMW74695.1 porin family protein [Saprospiraceae bacterium]HMX82738.1 porin family protein [Saprospiraceae bacterium]HMX85267.1 porin family protein [Saprospiraceae bacterium]
MQKIKFWNLQFIYCLQIVLFCLIYTSATAQKFGSNQNYLEFKNKPYYFGITLGYNSSDYKLFRSQNFIGNDSIRLAESVKGPGFNLGIVTNYKINEYFDLRLLPTLSFAERNITYAVPKNRRPPYLQKIESVFFEIPVHLRYTSHPYKDIRAFILGGVKYSVDVASNSRTRQKAELLKVSPSDFSVELGAGIQMFFPYFIFSPEIKFSRGISNILIFDKDLKESNILEKILSSGFTISFHFEG